MLCNSKLIPEKAEAFVSTTTTTSVLVVLASSSYSTKT